MCHLTRTALTAGRCVAFWKIYETNNYQYMFLSKKFIFKTYLPLETAKARIEQYSGYGFRNNLFTEKGGLSMSNSPIFGNMAMINGLIELNESETVLFVTVKLHPVGKIAIIIGLFFGVGGLLCAVLKPDISQLVGLIPIGIIYPLVLFTYSFDSGTKIKNLKNALNIK